MHDDPFARAVQKVQQAEKAEREAGRRRRQERMTAMSRSGFRIHASVYVATNLLLITIWAVTWLINDLTGYPWFIYPLLGWGIGLAAHFAAVQHHLSRGPRPARSEVAGDAGGSVPSAPSTTEELSRLAELHRAGSLSDREFEAAKAKLLD